MNVLSGMSTANPEPPVQSTQPKGGLAILDHETAQSASKEGLPIVFGSATENVTESVRSVVDPSAGEYVLTGASCSGLNDKLVVMGIRIGEEAVMWHLTPSNGAPSTQVR